MIKQVRPKKIAYLCTGGSMGGSQRQLLYLIENLDPSEFEPVVLCRRDGTFNDALKNLKAKTLVRSMHEWRKFPQALLRYFDARLLVRALTDEAVSAVHCSDIWLGGYALWISRRLSVPSIIHVRMPVRSRDVRKHRLDKADACIAISARVKSNLLNAGISAEKITQIDDGVDTGLFRPGCNGDVLGRDFNLDGQIRIGIAGRVTESKRQMDFLRAARIIREKLGDKVIFFIVGRCDHNGYYNSLQKVITSNGLKGRIFFTGQRNDMPEVLCSLDILVSLSGGSVMFEAMSCAKAVISAGFTSARYAVHLQHGRTGLLVTSKSTSDLVDAMKTLIEDHRLRTRLGQQGRDWVVNNLTCQRMARKTQHLYQSILQNGS